MVIESIISDDSEYFEHNKIKLLSDDIRFLNAFPNPEPDKLAALPSIKGFYEDKNGSNFTSVIVNSDFKPGLKRAKLGSFCAVDNDGNIKYWNADTDGVMRIKRNIDEDSLPFRTRCLSPGQVFDGFIVLKDASMASAIMKAFNKTLWIGADRYEGFGKCIVEKCESVDIMPVEKEYGFSVKRPVKSDSICMLAVSAFTMLNCKGEPCGINTEELAEKLGAGSVEIESCSTSVSEYGSYNRTWGCRTSAVKMYDQGSIFKLKLDKVLIDTASIEKIQKEGLGIRKNEGFGQVVFFDPSLLENLKKNSLKDANREWRASDASLARRAKYNWVMKSSEEFDFGNISDSQLGVVQSLCERIKLSGDVSAIGGFFKKNTEERGVEYSRKFTPVKNIIENMINMPLNETLSIEEGIVEDSLKEKMNLLILLFNYMRKSVSI